MRNLVFLGPPGAGKGTMAEIATERYGHCHISTGDILRAEMKSGSDLGRKAKSFVESGGLVPDQVVADIVSGKLAEDGVRSKGFILDGYPRTVVQADLLEAALVRLALPLEAAVLFEVDRELLLKRLTARRLCRSCGAIFNTLYSPPAREGVCDHCGGPLYQRPDDTLETALNRLTVYERETLPLIAYYDRKKLLIRVSGAEARETNFALLRQRLGW